MFIGYGTSPCTLVWNSMLDTTFVTWQIRSQDHADMLPLLTLINFLLHIWYGDSGSYYFIVLESTLNYDNQYIYCNLLHLTKITEIA